jgi:transposase
LSVHDQTESVFTIHRNAHKRPDTGKFVVLPKRWIVERTIAWLNRCRRLAKDWECLNRNGLAFLRWASVRLMVRKLCQSSK